MRIVLVGAVEATRVAIEALAEYGRLPVALLTLPPSALGRHSDGVDLAPVAARHGIELIYSTSVNSRETLEALAIIKPDIVLAIGWSQICRAPFRSAAKLGCVGFHPSALPKMRGRAVIPWTILTGVPTTGSTFFWLSEGVNAGDIILQRRFPVAEDETARSLYTKHLQAMRDMLPEIISMFAKGKPVRQPQREEDVSYCARRTPEDGIIDWREPADAILRFVRAVGDPYPGAFTPFGGALLFIDKARMFENSHQYIGLAGQIQSHTDLGFTVKCGDGNCIEVLEWRWIEGKRPPKHVMLGREGA